MAKEEQIFGWELQIAWSGKRKWAGGRGNKIQKVNERNYKLIDQ